jgi:hypothetical protein
MKLENALSIIADDIRDAEEQEVLLCLAKYLFANNKEIKHLTYSNIAQVTGSKQPETLLRITQYLAGERVKLLDMKFELIIDEDITPLDEETMYHAETTGDLVHPDTGRTVENYDQFVYPYFIPSREIENG